MNAVKLKQKKGTKPRLTLKLGQILKLVARYEEMLVIQQRGYPDADISFIQGLTQEEKNLLDLYMEKKIEVIFEPITMANGKRETADRKSKKKPEAKS